MKKILMLKSNNNISNKFISKNNKRNSVNNLKIKDSFKDCEVGNKIEDDNEMDFCLKINLDH